MTVKLNWHREGCSAHDISFGHTCEQGDARMNLKNSNAKQSFPFLSLDRRSRSTLLPTLHSDTYIRNEKYPESYTGETM